MAGRAATPEVIWARPERAGRGPKPAYSRADIAAAAVRIADADGIDAVSMRRVAGELGCGTMSLYNYVPRKEDLYELMVDAVSADYELPAGPGAADWRAEILALARQTRDMMRRHPWLARVMSPLYGCSPNALRFLEHCLGALEGLDAPSGTKMELIGMVNGSVMTYVANEFATAERTRSLPWSAEQEQAARFAYLAGQVGGGAYPRLAAAFAQGPGPGSADDIFDRMLNRLLDSFAGAAGSAD
ncbi:TetR/AcrR family transcriptional regulator [Streptomyces kanamyceticus]|uniref:TetR/AcrR family transcriptional regulator n=1 Tax=Streptomyces kanamyceticus TaxID=1967 RepID=A0A5J6GQS0_STRKN|nr:TetR/AcrR family transcriptional regulator [Streptomyces kanamyceticus]QEU95396.1 TetR/AcrR family transcriptional regulator [Streptomyces kanamyceticus]